MSFGPSDLFAEQQSLPSLAGPGPKSLAQSARMKSLNQARVALIAIGVITIAANLIFGMMAESAVKEEIDKELTARGLNRGTVNQIELQKVENAALRATRLASYGFAALGAVFIGAGMMIKQYPVPISITSLVLYLGATVVTGVLNWQTLLQGIIIKVIVIVVLVKAVQAAIAYQKALDAEAQTGFAGTNG